MKSRPLSKPAAIGWAGFYAALGVASAAGAVGVLFAPNAEDLAFVPKILFPMATFLTVAAVVAFMRRDPDAPTKWKDLARPVFASLTVLSSMLAALHPLWALGGVFGAGAATWAGLSNGWMDNSIFKDENAGPQDDGLEEAPTEDVELNEASTEDVEPNEATDER